MTDIIEDYVAAAAAGDIETVRAALAAGVDINAASKEHHQTAIAAAAMREGHPEIVRFLLDEGADPNAFDNRPALSIAASRGHVKILQMLLNAGADPNVADEIGETPLMNAAGDARFECARILINAGADVNAVSLMEKVPLSEAYDYEWRFKKRNPVIDLLVEAGAKLGIHEKVWKDWKRPEA